jgi:hypothetical protein
MKRFRRVIFYSFIASTLAITAFAFYLFSGQPNKKQMAEAFPLNSEKIFSSGKSLTLYSLEPLRQSEKSEEFQGYAVIGKTEIHNQSFKQFLKKAFLNDLADSNIKTECFNPRHGIRIADGNETVDLLISFECENFVSFAGEQKGAGNIFGKSKVLFDQALTDAGIK